MLFWTKAQHNLSQIRQKFQAGLAAIFDIGLARWLLIVALGLDLLNWLAMSLIYRNLVDGLTVLHYNFDFGIDLLGQPYQVFTYPLLGLVFILINLIILTAYLAKSDFKFLARLVSGGILVINFWLLAASLALYLVNFV